MPIYDFKCEQCEYVGEYFISAEELDDQECSKCGATAKQQISAPNVIVRIKDRAAG